MNLSKSSLYSRPLSLWMAAASLGFATVPLSAHVQGHGEHGHDHDELDPTEQAPVPHADHDPNPEEHPGEHRDHGHSHDEHTHGGTAAGVVVTQFTDTSELFMEHDSLVQGVETRLIVHLTRLSDFSPITRGNLEVRLISQSGEVYRKQVGAPARDGIFLPVITPPFAGDSTMELQLSSDQLEVVHVIPNTHIYRTPEAVPLAHDSEATGEQISFLKEQQWRIHYATAAAEQREVSQAIAATGEIILPESGRWMITAPISGIVRFVQPEHLQIGVELNQGDAVFELSPGLSGMDGILHLQKQHRLATLEYQKLQQLQTSQAVSSERLEIARIEFETLDRAMRNLGMDPAEATPQPRVNAPISGQLESIAVHPGEAVAEHQILAVLRDTSTVVLQVRVPTSRLIGSDPIGDGVFQPLGLSQPFLLSELGGQLVTPAFQRSDTPGISILRFVLPNPLGTFAEGVSGPVQLLTRSGQPVTAIPESAVREEDGIPVVYVQVEGETIERRVPRLGRSDSLWVEVLEGIQPGERVVTHGTTQIRLSTMSSTEMGHGHAH